jgi:hypothetical protein
MADPISIRPEVRKDFLRCGRTHREFRPQMMRAKRDRNAPPDRVASMTRA